MNALWLLFLCCLKWEVEANRLKYEIYGEEKTVSLYMGTPAQGPLDMRLSILHEDVPNDFVADIKRFNANRSTTFKIKSTDQFYWYGTDVVKMTDKVVIDSADVAYISGLVPGRFPFMSIKLRMGEDGSKTFLDKLLDSVNGDRAMVAYVKESHSSQKYEGAIIFGENQPSECSNSWKGYKAAKRAGSQFMLESEEFSVGKFHRAKKVAFGISDNTLYLDPEAYDAALKQLGVNNRRRIIDCNTKTQIRITVGGHEYVIDPKVYVDKEPGRNHFCTFSALKSEEDRILLPLTALAGHCIRFDYSRHELGFSSVAA